MCKSCMPISRLCYLYRELEDCRDQETSSTLAPSTLVEQCSKVVGTTWSFEEVVQMSPAPIPDDVQQRIAFWAFPRDEKKIKMYASLGNSSAHVFQEAEHLLRKGKLQKMYQIGKKHAQYRMVYLFKTLYPFFCI